MQVLFVYMITFHDVSQWQGDYDDDNPVIAIKMSGGDAGLYFDSKANGNYKRASAKGKAIIGYHFAGGLTPEDEADFFLKAMSPLAENDILCLDWEIQHVNPVEWVEQFMARVHAQCGVWPLIYMNTATCNSYDWSPVLANCGLWIADYRFTPDQTVPCGHPYIIHQYTSTPLDTDALFIDVETLKKYGFHAPQAAPAPAPQPLPTTTTASVPNATITITQAPPAPLHTYTTPPTKPTQRPPAGRWAKFWAFVKRLLRIK